MSVLLPTSLAEAVVERFDFEHGLKMDDVLMGLFKKAEDRDYCRDMLEDVWPAGDWKEVTLGH
jgi:hypothetical protein